MNEKGRKELGRRIRAKRIKEFGTSTAAEREAKVNNATLKRAEQGLPVRDDRLAAIIKALWPASDGDWERLDDPPASTTERPRAVGAEGLSHAELLTELANRLGMEVSVRPQADTQPAEGSKSQKTLDDVTLTSVEVERLKPTPELEPDLGKERSRQE